MNRNYGFSRIVFSIIFFACFQLASIQVANAQHPLPQDFELTIKKGMEDWQIPGLAIAIVKDGKVFYSKGFGVKKLGANEPVNDETLFGIASVSKNITAAALAMLVDEGKISWDTKIVDVIPWFALSDPWVTSQVTVRDALTHRVGLGRMIGNRLQFMSGRSRDELIYRLRYMDFEQPFRTSYVYSNMMYSVAGQVIEYVSGKTWDEFLAERIFQPLGMKSNTSILSLNDASNAAWPHQYIEGEVVPIPRRNWDNAGPAGGINASVKDVAKWLILQLGEPGVYEGKTYISKAQMAEIHKPQVVRPSNNPYGSQTTYGLGWNILDYEGHRVLTHGGATDGFNTAAYLLPDQNLGIIVVGNSFNQLGDALAYTVMDAFIGKNSVDWQQRYFDGYQRSMQTVNRQREAIHAARVSNTIPSLPLSQYAVKFEHPAYESAEVRLNQANQLELILWDNEEVVADLEHWHHDTFRAVWRNPAMREEFVYFTKGKNGELASMTVEFVLRPALLQAGAYPSSYTRSVVYKPVKN
jgi:CubicO group peptidase (beta-lactamase class C family)